MKIMAIVNVTPDSFHDGGRHDTTDAAVAFALRCVAEGADILDIGGESSRPGSAPVSASEEVGRVLPVVAGIRRQNPSIPISIDTTKAVVIREAAPHGIQWVNDITALQGDPEMAATVAQLGLGVVLMHMRGNPGTMQQAPVYEDVVAEVKGFLSERIAAAVAAGIPRDRLLIDPGIGFGKTVAHNLALLRNLSALSTLNCPLVVGTSRKSFIGALGMSQPLGPEAPPPPAADRLPGSLATLPAMVRAGVAFVRTHDVAATRQFLQVYSAE